MSDDDFRRLFQEVKRMTLAQFTKKMNTMHSNAWHKCYIQFREAITETLPPKLAEKLLSSHRRIVTQYDGIKEITLDLQDISETDFREVIQENRRLGYERMIEIIREEAARK